MKWKAERGNDQVFLTSIHDNAEVRIGDHHKLMKAYMDGKKDFEKKAFEDQCSSLPNSIPQNLVKEKIIKPLKQNVPMMQIC